MGKQTIDLFLSIVILALAGNLAGAYKSQMYEISFHKLF
jgi:hypothetical protein